MKYNGILLMILGFMLMVSVFIKNDNSKEYNHTSIVGGIILIGLGGLFIELSRK